MRLRDLAGIDSDTSVTGFAIDHRKVAPGTVFGAFRGARFNGEDFIPQAIASGAAAIVARPEAVVEGAPHIGAEAPRRSGDALVEPVGIGGIERIDRIEPLGGVPGGQPDHPGAIILDGSRRPGAEARRLVAAHAGQMRGRLLRGQGRQLR